MATKRRTTKKSHKAKYKRGDPVSWKHRSATGHGTIRSRVSVGSTPGKDRYAVNEVDHHVSAKGKREKSVVIHTGAALHRSTSSAVRAAAKKGRARNSKKKRKTTRRRKKR